MFTEYEFYSSKKEKECVLTCCWLKIIPNSNVSIKPYYLYEPILLQFIGKFMKFLLLLGFPILNYPYF